MISSAKCLHVEKCLNLLLVLTVVVFRSYKSCSLKLFTISENINQQVIRCYTRKWKKNQTVINYHMMYVGIPLTSLTSSHFCSYPLARTLIYNITSRQWSFFCVLWVTIRGSCSFCWYWRNCWPSFLNFLFIIV
jgi:hypothetical protein